MRRWNGWGDTTTAYHVPAAGLAWLAESVGQPQAAQDARIEDIVANIPPSQLPEHPQITTDPEDRLRHARGQSLPDWVALRSGRINRFPDGIVYPETAEDLETLFVYAQQHEVALIPYGGGTSVVGGINPEQDGPPTLTVDLSGMSKLKHFDEVSRLATFGAGIKGPNLEAALRARGYMLGHFPQSFELSTLGGWIATRSSGQQSLHYGRVETFFAGGKMVTPAGTLRMNPYPASAAGPDIRELVLGSEGRKGIISEAIVRISPQPEHESFHAVFFPDWQAGMAAVREIVQARLPLSMLRLSNGTETEVNLKLAGREQLVNLAHTGLSLIGQQQNEKCLLLFGVTGSSASVRYARQGALSIARRHRGFSTGQYMGKVWAKSRFKTPYLRNSLWELGYAIDTLETIVPWADVPETANAIIDALNNALADTDERVLVFAHLSHLYPTGASIYVTYMFRVLADPDQQLEYWQRLKRAGSEAVIAHGGTITHQHAVGVDHVPYLAAEKGELGMKLIKQAITTCDPNGLLNPGKLIR